MNEIQLVNEIDSLRIDMMKLKYYAFVDSYKKAYSENPSPVDTYNFIQAAIRLASDDVCDIIFPYSLVQKEKQDEINKSLRKPKESIYRTSDPSEDNIGIE